MQAQPSAVIQAVLASMRKVTPIESTPFDPSVEWMRIRSRTTSDYALFQKFRFQWPSIAGLHMDKVALVHCKSDPHAGLWLHDLSSTGAKAIYLAGCREVATWNQQAELVTRSAIAEARAGAK